MKNLAFILVSIVAVAGLLLVGSYLLWPPSPPPQPPLVISIDGEIAPFQAQLARQEAATQAQLDELLASLQTRQAALNAQTERWQQTVDATQQQVDDLTAQAQNLQLQISQLTLTRTISSTATPANLEQVRRQYDSRLSALESQLQATQLRLEQVNAQLQN